MIDLFAPSWLATSGCVGHGPDTSARLRVRAAPIVTVGLDQSDRCPEHPPGHPGPDAGDPPGRGRAVDVEHGRYLAEHIPGAKYVEVPGIDSLIWAGDQDPIVAEIQEFVTGVRPAPTPHRVLATVLFTDIVGSTRLAADWATGAGVPCSTSTTGVDPTAARRFGGREIKTAGDGILATFDGPARAIRCAVAIRDARRATSASTSGRGCTPARSRSSRTTSPGIAVHIGARDLGAGAAAARSSCRGR